MRAGATISGGVDGVAAGRQPLDRLHSSAFPRHLKELIAPYVLHPDACVAEPVLFEVLRHASDEELGPLQAQFDTMPMLVTPATLWRDAVDLGRQCRRRGINAGSLDLLVASTALHHNVELVTFDADFVQIASVCNLRVTHLLRP